MSNPKSIFASLGNLAVVAALGFAAWYGYTHWVAEPDGRQPPSGQEQINCKHALASLADAYACRDSASCELDENELLRLKELELTVDRQCN